MNSLELLVVQEIFMSETAKLATVVLPGTTFLEKDGNWKIYNKLFHVES